MRQVDANKNIHTSSSSAEIRLRAFTQLILDEHLEEDTIQNDREANGIKDLVMKSHF